LALSLQGCASGVPTEGLSSMLGIQASPEGVRSKDSNPTRYETNVRFEDAYEIIKANAQRCDARATSTTMTTLAPRGLTPIERGATVTGELRAADASVYMQMNSEARLVAPVVGVMYVIDIRKIDPGRTVVEVYTPSSHLKEKMRVVGRWLDGDSRCAPT
jgi:hypothetical protein